MTTAAVPKMQIVPGSQYKEMIDKAYMAGYTDAMTQERERKKEAKRRRERKKYFAVQKITGVAMFAFTAVAAKLLDGDITIAFITIPLGLCLLLSREMLIINKYYWKCNEAEREGGNVIYH